MSSHAKNSAFQVPLVTHWLSGCVDRWSDWWIRLGQLESRTLREQLDQTPLEQPLYVTGIARAGTTLLLELLARQGEVATHQYRDFPGQFVPVWWSRGQRRECGPAAERAHGDRLCVTEHSPEAMEEPLWMAFFSHLHDPQQRNVLDAATSYPAFEQFYTDHLRKMLLVRRRTRYGAKGNYNLTRLAYLHKLLPSARFVVAIRHPRDHIASLVRQHQRFCAGEREYPRALAHMQRVGHFEFGLDRRPVSVGDGVAEQVADLWQRGEEVRGTARYWASLYGWLADQLAENQDLAQGVQLVRYEDLCQQPQQVVGQVFEHANLALTPAVEQFLSQVAAPDYYAPTFTDQEEAAIAEETHEVAVRFGYGTGSLASEGVTPSCATGSARAIGPFLGSALAEPVPHGEGEGQCHTENEKASATRRMRRPVPHGE